jgi:hypothetical protein
MHRNGPLARLSQEKQEACQLAYRRQINAGSEFCVGQQGISVKAGGLFIAVANARLKRLSKK